MGVRLVVRSTWSSEATAEYTYEFDQPRIAVGRHRGADIHIPHPAVSGNHATFRAEGARWVVVDEGSTNGTRVGTQRLPPGRPKSLTPGDVVVVGGFRITLSPKPVVTATNLEKTASLARQIVQGEWGRSGGTETPQVRVLNGPEEGRVVDVPPPPGRLVLGRGEEVDLALPDEDLSREHAELVADLDGILARDLASKNGTFVNDKTMTVRRLKDGDELRLGKTVLVFEDPTDRRLSAICDAADVVMEPPESEPEPETEEAATVDADIVPSATDLAQPARASVRKPRRAGFGADLFIYVLAGAVLALSIAGLVVLLRAG